MLARYVAPQPELVARRPSTPGDRNHHNRLLLNQRAEEDLTLGRGRSKAAVRVAFVWAGKIKERREDADAEEVEDHRITDKAGDAGCRGQVLRKAAKDSCLGF